MTTLLPLQPDLAQLKRQAKELLRAHHHGDPTACPSLRTLRQFATASDAEILAAGLKLHDVQFALALGYGFSSWERLKHHIEQAPLDYSRYNAHLTRYPAFNSGKSDVPPFSYASANDVHLQRLCETYGFARIAGNGDTLSRAVRLMHWVHGELLYPFGEQVTIVPSGCHDHH